MMHQLEKLKPAGITKLNAALRKIIFSRLTRGIVFVISDFYSEDGFEALKLLGSAGHDLHCWHLLTTEEWNPGIRGELRFLDSESTERTEVTISPHVLKAYKQRLTELQNQIKRVAHQSNASYFALNSDASIGNLILRDLRRQGILL
jgi:hypothetical protein